MKKVSIVIVLLLFVVAFLGTVGFLYNKSQEPPVIYETDEPFIADIVRKAIKSARASWSRRSD